MHEVCDDTERNCNIPAYNFLKNMPNMNVIDVITYFSFVENF